MSGISEEIIRQRAHAIWEAQGKPEGHHLEHWEQAVRELMNGSSAPLTHSVPKVAAARAAETKVARQKKAPLSVRK